MTQPKFQKIQESFAAHLRDPLNVLAPEGIQETRLQIYRDLFYRNIEGFIANALPVCSQVLGNNRWHELVRDFYAQHCCLSPYFLDVSREFIDYLWLERDSDREPAFLKELALYEWLDLHVQISDVEPAAYDASGDVLLGCPFVSPWLVLQSFTYSVQDIRVGSTSIDPLPIPIFLLVYRDLQDSVQIVELNAVSARCLSLLQCQPSITGQEMLNMVADELAYDDVGRQQFLSFGAEILQQWHSKDILLGTWLD